MKNPRIKLFVCLMMVAFTGACATPFQPVPSVTPQAVDGGSYRLKTQNVVIVMDASSSMAEGYGQYRKFDIATATVGNLIKTMPENVGIKSALRSFGHNPKLSSDSTLALYEMGNFSRSGMTGALAKIAASGGPSPLCKAIAGAGADLKGATGKSALIVVTDGEDLGKEPILAATALKAEFKDALCIYPILVGDNSSGKDLMGKLAKIGGCGVAVNANDLASGASMNDYVSDIFVGEILDSDGDGVADAMDKCPGTPAGTSVDAYGCPLDSDGDGVADNMDECSGTPAGTKVDAYGCPLDSDGDGVADAIDQCPGTPAGKKVDAYGCAHSVLKTSAGSWTFHDIGFNVGKADLTPSSHGVLDDIAAALNARPQLKVIVEGHTDSTGTRAVNMRLSEKRAQSVVDYLVGKGVSRSRLSAKGCGPDRPIADNGTKAGRAKNRRVQFTKVD